MPITPNPATSPNQSPESLSGTEGWLDDAPGGDTEFDKLFSLSDQGADDIEDPPEPQASPDPQEPFLKAEHTVYNTPDDAIRGTNEKDRIISYVNQNREQITAATGVDPMTGRAVSSGPPEPQANGAPSSYIENPENYVRDLQSAASKNDSKAFAAIHQRMVDEELDRRLAPLAPLVSTLAKRNAIEEIGANQEGFGQFLSGPEYSKVLESVPVLQGAIKFAENEMEAHGQLPELYRLAYLASQGQRATGNSGAPAPVVAPVPAPVPPARPRTTTRPATMTPPTAPGAVSPGLDTPEGRAEIIRQAEGNSGVMEFQF